MPIGFISAYEAAERWGITRRQVTKLCSEGRIEGVQRFAKYWVIPEIAKKPEDNRRFNGAHMKKIKPAC